MQIYAGSYSTNLAAKLAKLLNLPLGQSEITQFPNKEARVWVKEPKIAKEVIVVQSFAIDPNRAIIEFCLLVDALKRSGAQQVTVVIPWMGYCIQDKIFRQGEPLSSKVVADIIMTVDPVKVITVDLHNETIQGFFPRVSHLSATPLFIKHFKKHKKPSIVIAPDVGALKETTEIAHSLDLPIAVLNKKRDRNTGKVEIVGVDGDIEGSHALIMDDFISTGGTLIQTANYLKTNGVQTISVAVTHNLYVPGVMKKLANSDIDHLYVTDTIQIPEEDKEYMKKKLDVQVISVAELIAQVIE